MAVWLSAIQFSSQQKYLTTHHFKLQKDGSVSIEGKQKQNKQEVEFVFNRPAQMPRVIDVSESFMLWDSDL